jgi:hypothetical protein
MVKTGITKERMMPKLSDEALEILNNCIVECETCITACQDLVDMCSASNGPECAESVGKAVKQWTITIEACNQTFKWCNKAIKGAGTSQDLYNKCSAACDDAIDMCKKCIMQCKSGNEECINACLDCIVKCNDLVQLCDEIIEKAA